MLTPAPWFPRLELPRMLVPMKLPTIEISLAPELRTMPSPVLPEITLPAPLPVPPMVLLGLARETPSPMLGNARAPEASVPTRFA